MVCADAAHSGVCRGASRSLTIRRKKGCSEGYLSDAGPCGFFFCFFAFTKRQFAQIPLRCWALWCIFLVFFGVFWLCRVPLRRAALSCGFFFNDFFFERLCASIGLFAMCEFVLLFCESFKCFFWNCARVLALAMWGF